MKPIDEKNVAGMLEQIANPGIRLKKKPMLYSSGNDETSYKGNQLSRVIAIPKRLEGWQL